MEREYSIKIVNRYRMVKWILFWARRGKVVGRCRFFLFFRDFYVDFVLGSVGLGVSGVFSVESRYIVNSCYLLVVLFSGLVEF